MPISTFIFPTQNIISNTIWDGAYILDQDIHVQSGAILTIKPGTGIFMDTDVTLTVDVGAKIIAEGSEEYPITFTGENGASWDRIEIHGDNSSFNYCNFDGGYLNIYNRADGTVINNCKFTNAYAGVYSTSKTDGSRSSITLGNCVVENNLHGLYISYTDASITNSTIQNQSYYGIYTYRADLGKNDAAGGMFSNNIIQNNGHEGIRMNYDGDVYLGYGSFTGSNIIKNNGYDEIKLESTSSTTHLGQSNYGAGSDIYDHVNTGYYYIVSARKFK
ncbi:MAG: hypothetical protein KAI81_00020 [Candidatus Marinimicrobia bacterium]|nr:hypothetical protein [Candidatus Neomarinimicrobiota bacterium]